MNRRRFLLSAAAAAAGGARGFGVDTMRGGAAAAQPVGAGSGTQAALEITGVDYFPVYYAWYSAPDRWSHNPDYQPELGRYQSAQPAVIARHMGWLEEGGGAGFTINWHGAEGFVHETVAAVFIPQIANFRGQEFCIHYDPYIRWGLPMPDFTSDQAARATWRSDARTIARDFMSHPQYARVGTRPLLFVYLSRAIEGLDNLEAFVDIARAEAAAAGHPGIYLVLGEVWWIPTDETPINIEIIKSVRAPRTRLGDAMYSYNLATEPVHERVWRGNIRTFLGEAVRVYKDYRNLMDARGAADKRLITTLMPRFDNTVLRADRGEPAGMNIGPWRGYGGVDYRRDVAAVFGKLSTSFEPVRDGRAITVVTSWNEWPERSALEPSGGAIDKDGLQGPRHAYLDSLRDAVATYPQPADPTFRAEGGLATSPAAALEDVDMVLDLSSLRADDTEKVTPRDVTGGRLHYRAELVAGALR